MICIKCNGCFILFYYFYRKWLSGSILQIHLLPCFQFFCPRKLCQFHRKNGIRICQSVGFLRHQMNIQRLSDFHVGNCCIKSFDHLTCTADKFKWFSAVI